MYYVICLFMSRGIRLEWYMYGGQRKTCRTRFSPSNTWVLGIQLMVTGDFSCLAALAFTYQATYPGPEVIIQEMISHLMDNRQQRTVIF